MSYWTKILLIDKITYIYILLTFIKIFQAVWFILISNILTKKPPSEKFLTLFYRSRQPFISCFFSNLPSAPCPKVLQSSIFHYLSFYLQSSKVKTNPFGMNILYCIIIMILSYKNGSNASSHNLLGSYHNQNPYLIHIIHCLIFFKIWWYCKLFFFSFLSYFFINLLHNLNS